MSDAPWQAYTKDEYDALMAGRSHPLGSTMSTWRANKTREQTAVEYTSPIPEQVTRTPLEHIPELKADRQRRTQRPPCGTNRGYASHLRWNETPCHKCFAAHSAQGLAYKRPNPPNRRKAT